jgi:hypothetical protein
VIYKEVASVDVQAVIAKALTELVIILRMCFG